MCNGEDKEKSTPAMDDLVAQWFVHIQEYAREHGSDPEQIAIELAKSTKRL